MNDAIFEALQSAQRIPRADIEDVLNDLKGVYTPNNEQDVRNVGWMQAAALSMSNRAREMLYNRDPAILRGFDLALGTFQALIRDQGAATTTRALAQQIAANAEGVIF